MYSPISSTAPSHPRRRTAHAPSPSSADGAGARGAASRTLDGPARTLDASRTLRSTGIRSKAPRAKCVACAAAGRTRRTMHCRQTGDAAQTSIRPLAAIPRPMCTYGYASAQHASAHRGRTPPPHLSCVENRVETGVRGPCVRLVRSGPVRPGLRARRPPRPPRLEGSWHVVTFERNNVVTFEGTRKR
jgi:hypothetical protein